MSKYRQIAKEMNKDFNYLVMFFVITFVISLIAFLGNAKVRMQLNDYQEECVQSHVEIYGKVNVSFNEGKSWALVPILEKEVCDKYQLVRYVNEVK